MQRPVAIALIILAALVATYVGIQFFRAEEPPELVEEEAPLPALEPAEEIAEPATRPPLELPPLADSDATLRQWLRGLSSNPGFAEWVVANRLADRFVVAVNNVARGESPRTQLPFLEPADRFQALQGDRGFVVDPAGYHRYDDATTVLASLDVAAAARLYEQTLPLLEEAHAELGEPQSFDATLRTAIDHLLETPVVEGDIDLVQRVRRFDFADPELQELSTAQKHLVRMGPTNVRRVQSFLDEFRSLLPGPS